MKTLNNRRLVSLLVVGIFALSVFAYIPLTTLDSAAPEENKVADPMSALDLLDYDSIIDPTGESVKQNQKLLLGRDVKLDVIQPIDWSLDVLGVKVVRVAVPIDVDLTFGVTFPMNANISYDPYQVHAGQTFPYSVELSNENCTPYVTVGVVVDAKLSKIKFEVGNLPSLDFSVIFSDIYYANSWTIPFYGINTKMGNWIKYNIVDKYYTLEDLIRVDTKKYGVSGGVGINLQYNLDSYITADFGVDGVGSSAVSELRWDNCSRKDIDVDVAAEAINGQEFNVTVDNFVYHIKHDVTLTVWADLYLEVVGIKLLDERLDWSYTLPLGKIDFPERTQFAFKSSPQVLPGTHKSNVLANYDIVNFGWGPEGGQFTPFGKEIPIPENAKLKEWFTKMNIDAGVAARVGIDFPFNEVSYYNDRKVTAGNTFDHNLLLDSIDADPVGVNYNLNAFVDLSNVKIFNKNLLKKYEFNYTGDILDLAGIGDFVTPFDKYLFEHEITKTVKLDAASKALNDYISSVCYGINPDIQFKAWVVLELQGYMTGDVRIRAGDEGIASLVGTSSGTSSLRWNQQYSTQTARIKVNDNAPEGAEFGVEYYNMKYHLNIKPGVKLGVTVLGGIIGFDFTLWIPGCENGFDLDIFDAPDFVETIEVQRLGTSISNFYVESSSINQGYPIVAHYDIKNDGTTSDKYIVGIQGLPVGTTATTTSPYQLGQWTPTVLPGETTHVELRLMPGPGAYKGEGFVNNKMVVTSTSISNPNIKNISSNVITINFVGGVASSERECLLTSEIQQTSGIVNEKAAILKGQTLKYRIGITNLATEDYSYEVYSSPVTKASAGTFSGTSGLSAGITAVLEQGKTGYLELTINVGADCGAGLYKIDVTCYDAIIETEELQFYVVESMSNVGQFTANPTGEPYAFTLSVYDRADITPGVEVVVPVKIKNVGLVNDKYNIALQNIQNIGGKTDYVTLSASSLDNLKVGEEGTVNVNIVVPRSQLSAAGSYSFDVKVTSVNGGDVQTQTVSIDVAPYVQVKMYEEDIEDREVIYVGGSVIHSYVIENKGNAQADVELIVEADDGITATTVIDGVVGPSAVNISIPAGEYRRVKVKYTHDSSSLPGSFDYTVSAYIPGDSEDKVQVFQTKGAIAVEGVSVAVTADEFTLNEENLEYFIIITNKGSEALKYNVTLVGLPEDSYTVAKNIMVPANDYYVAKITLLKDAVPNIEAGIAGFIVKLTSAGYESERYHSAVLISEYYNNLVLPAKAADASEYTDYTYTITNKGNTVNTYDVVVDGSLPYEVFSSVVAPTEFVSGNKVVVERGQTVEITVRIYKSGKAGIYKPEIKITDSQGSVVVAEPVEVKFGTYLTVGGIIGIIAGVALLAVGALAVFHMQRTGKLDDIRSRMRAKREFKSTAKRNVKELFTAKEVKPTKFAQTPVDYLKDQAIIQGKYIITSDAEELVTTFRNAKGRDPNPKEMDKLLNGYFAKKNSFSDSGWE